MGDNLLHLCYLPQDLQNTLIPSRISPENTNLPPAEFSITKLSYPPDKNVYKPEITKWFVDYAGSLSLSEAYPLLWFQFEDTPGA